ISIEDFALFERKACFHQRRGRPILLVYAMAQAVERERAHERHVNAVAIHANEHASMVRGFVSIAGREKRQLLRHVAWRSNQHNDAIASGPHHASTLGPEMRL